MHGNCYQFLKCRSAISRKMVQNPSNFLSLKANDKIDTTLQVLMQTVIAFLFKDLSEIDFNAIQRKYVLMSSCIHNSINW